MRSNDRLSGFGNERPRFEGIFVAAWFSKLAIPSRSRDRQHAFRQSESCNCPRPVSRYRPQNLVRRGIVAWSLIIALSAGGLFDGARFGGALVGRVLAADSPAKATVPAEPPADHALVAGFERFFQSRASEVAPGELADAGRLLLGELNCLSCHKAEGALAERLSPKQAPILNEVGGRLRAGAIRKLLNDPHTAKAGTTMPHVLATLPDAERAEVAEALTHFLAKTGGVHDSLADAKSVREGETLYHQLGCVACHTPFKAPPDITKPKDPNFEDDEPPAPSTPTTATFVPLGNIPASIRSRA